MLDVRTDYFLPLALHRLSTGTIEDRKETIELLLLYHELYHIPKPICREIVARIIPQLKLNSPYLRYWSACALGEYECIEALQPLRATLEEESDPLVRGWIQGAIAHLTHLETAQALNQLLSRNPETRALAAQALFFDQSPLARGLITKGLDESDITVLPWKLLAIPGRWQRRRRAPLIWYPEPNRSISNRERNIQQEHEMVSQNLISLLFSGNDLVAEFAVWNLALARDENALPVIQQIVEVAHKTSPSVREWVYKYLGFLRRPQPLPVLTTALKFETDPDVREGIAFALGQIGGPLAIELLNEMLTSEVDESVRKWSARAFAQIEGSWEQCENILLDALKTEKNQRVGQEIYRAFQIKGTPALLTRLPLLEMHAAENSFQTDIIELLIVLATKKQNLAAKDKLMELLPRAPTEPSDILRIARLLTEEYGLLVRSFSGFTVQTDFMDFYEKGLSYLFSALASYKQDPFTAKEDINHAQELLQRFITEQYRDQHSETSRLPVFAYAQFYIGLCEAYLQIAEAIENRLVNRLDDSTKQFRHAAAFFELHQKDTAFPPSERNLCAALYLWIDAQRQINILAQANHDPKQVCELIVHFLTSAIMRAKDSLRDSIVKHLEAMLEYFAKAVDTDQDRWLFDRAFILNSWLLAIPIAMKAPIAASNCISVTLLNATTTSRQTVFETRIDLNHEMLSQIEQPFDLVLKLSAGGSYLTGYQLTSKTEMLQQEESIFRCLNYNWVDTQLAANTFELLPILRFSDFEWVVDAPIFVQPSVKEGREGTTMSNENDALVDFAIVTALEDEVKAVLRHLGTVQTVQDEQDPITYYRGQVIIPETNERYEVVVVWLLSIGNNQAAATAAKLIARWQPNHIAMVGIAGGVRAKVALGDIVVASLCYYYEMKKITPKGEQLRPEQYPSDSLLFERARSYNLEIDNKQSKENKWQKKITVARPKTRVSKRREQKDVTDLAVEIASSPKAHFGPIASGEQVIQNKQHLDQLVQQCSGLLAIAMEGAGVARAALLYSKRPRFLEVRGVSDFADRSKNDVWHAFAADAAAAFMIDFLRSRPVSPVHRHKIPT